MSGNIDDFDAELAAIEWAISSLTHEVYITREQVGALASLMSQGLSNPRDRKLRITVLRVLVGRISEAITGVPVSSTKNLTGATASYLIEQLKENGSWRLSEHGRWLISAAEERTKVTAG